MPAAARGRFHARAKTAGSKTSLKGLNQGATLPPREQQRPNSPTPPTGNPPLLLRPRTSYMSFFILGLKAATLAREGRPGTGR
eukprot:scaffold679544_cov31-Prasinocladus_malaysianus.AAC.1